MKIFFHLFIFSIFASLLFISFLWKETLNFLLCFFKKVLHPILVSILYHLLFAPSMDFLVSILNSENEQKLGRKKKKKKTTENKQDKQREGYQWSFAHVTMVCICTYLSWQLYACLFLFIYLIFWRKGSRRRRKMEKKREWAPHGVHYVSHFIPCFFMKGERK